ncbi:MAG: TonB-dependent receptor [Gemmatimonadota bacterium]|nr:TonB-dependent receptor [Gemmatimonadota bacterium]
MLLFPQFSPGLRRHKDLRPVQGTVRRAQAGAPIAGAITDAREWTVIARHEGRTTTLGGVGLHQYTLVDANVQRVLAKGLRAFVSVENISDVRYEINISGAGTAANPFVISNGLPRTIRAGLEAFRF